MSWIVRVHRRVRKQLSKLPDNVKEALEALVVDLSDGGPVRGDWPNYSKLSGGKHHCHLTYSYVAIWIVENKKLKIIEVSYVGSRENAPY